MKLHIPHVKFLAALGLLLQAGVPGALAQNTTFTRAFAPEDGLVSQYEQPARAEICLNGYWQFQADPASTMSADTATPPGEWDKVAIKIPSPWNVNGFFLGEGGGDFQAYPSYPRQWNDVKAAWMQRTINVPQDWAGRRMVLHFNAVAGKLAVFVNGKPAGGGFDIFFPQEFDVTDLIHPGTDNQILVQIIASKVFDKNGRYGHREYISGSFWGTFISGIWQDVFLVAQPKVAVSDVFVQSWVNQNQLTVETTIANHGATPATVDLSGNVREWINEAGKSILDTPEVKWKLGDDPVLQLPSQPVTLAPGESRVVTLAATVDGHLKLWSPDTPNLYGLLLTVSANGQPVDTKYQRFGWRQFTLEGNRFLLNGQPIVMHGDSWHFLGIPQMTRRYAYGWYRMLKDAGANAVRLHATVYPSFYHDMADEMGILILDESAAWASDGGTKVDSDLFWTNCRTHVTELVLRDRNHPSVYGWSICNEILPVLRNVFHTPQKMVDHCLDEMAVWRDICLTNDPTRGWISGDGEMDADGRLPIINIHYGDDDTMRRASQSGKPWAVGETGMAYYGTPKQVSQYNGNRAYESDLGRMEGLAYESYSLLSAQQKYGANYESVFNIVWYGLQPMPLGKHVLSAPIDDNDGIFFGDYQEGVPGVQPERLGPYTTTLNPGYDPRLPLYRTWPMFNAIRAANTGNTNVLWAVPPDLSKPAPPPEATNSAATVAYFPGNGEALAQKLSRAGVQAAAYADGAKTDFLLVDGFTNQTAENIVALKNAAAAVLGHGGAVWVWNITPAGALSVSQMLGQEVTTEPRPASSFVVAHDDPLLATLDNAALYFSEGDDWRQMSFGLNGDFVKGARVVLEACRADWRQWNYQAEPVKTAKLYRSEVEHTNSRVAIAIRPVDQGRVILCNLSPDIRSPRKAEVIARLFQNEGIPIGQANTQNEFMDTDGRLMHALVCGSFAVNDPHDAYTGKPVTDEIKPGATLDNHRWRAVDAGADGVFDFRSGLVRGPEENAYVYLAVWVKSSKPLNDLLSEPNLPKLSLTFGSDDGNEVYLNGELLASNERTGPLEPEGFSINPLLLKLGWNQLVIKVVQGTGEWKFAGKFGCSDADFLHKLQFAAEKPAAE